MKVDKLVDHYKNYFGSEKEATNKHELQCYMLRGIRSGEPCAEHPKYVPKQSQRIKNKRRKDK